MAVVANVLISITELANVLKVIHVIVRARRRNICRL